MRVLALTLGVLLLPVAAPPPPFRSSVERLPAPLRAQVAAKLWHRGCPVPLSGLRLLRVGYWGFDGNVHQGRLIVNRTAAAPLARVFGRLFELRFPVRRMRPVATSGDDTASFECRDAAPSPCPGTSGTGHWSEHAYGEAVDLNPIENPYTGCGITREKASIPYLDRSRQRKGMVTPAVVEAFRSIGWGWGGDWYGTKDYMHFSASGH
ncbi:MAG: M15 family metallopeptidase [Gaiellaceae bacterium]